jgi:monooxygenase
VTETIDTDFCVVGGGPAGLTLALLLARAGADVVVVERARSFDRPYRGEILQPGALRILADIGVLDAVRRRGSYELSRFQLLEHGTVLMDVDYRKLPKPYDFLCSLPQRHLLEELHAAASAEPGFRQLSGVGANALLTDEGTVTGVTCGDSYRIRAHCVVAADGRYSRMRKLANVGYQRYDAFEHDILWFRLPAPDRGRHDIRVLRDAGSPVLVHDSYPDRLQVGWTLPHKGYLQLTSDGFDPVKAEIMRAAPQYADLIDQHVTKLTDLTLLDVFAGSADEWARDGLLFVGDAAHTHGPVGAQGINLAIQDAVVAHEVLLGSLRAKDASAERLSAFAARRRPSIDRVTALQTRQARAMLASGRVARAVRPAATRLLAHTPIYRKVLDQLAFGDATVRVPTGTPREGKTAL